MTYLNVDEVETATVNLASAHPSLAQLVTLPNATAEGRTSHAIRLGGGAAGSRDAVMIICGAHAREWGSCEIGVNLATDLLEAYSSNMGLSYGGKSFTAAQIKTLLDTLHIVVFPCINPDGREYAMFTDPNWRKNRNPAYSGGDPNRIGVDVNRNYDFLFDFATAFAPGSGVSVSDDTSSEIYQGPNPFSEAETQNVRFLLDTFTRTRWFVDVHSFQRDMLWNWGDDDDQTLDPSQNFHNPAFDGKRGVSSDAYSEYIQFDDLIVIKSLANRFVTDLKAVRGEPYVAKSSYDLYPTSGASDDYVYSRHIVDPSKSKIHGFVIEWGLEFQPPWSEMVNIIKDVTAGLIGMCIAAPCGDGIPVAALKTPTLDFHNVPAGVQTTRAAVFSVQSCGAVDLNVDKGPEKYTGTGSFGLPLGGTNSLPSAPSAIERDVHVWVSYTGTNPGDSATGSMSVRCPQSGADFVVPITANTIAQPKVAACLVLDQSSSMNDPSGIPGKKRIDVLHEAAPNFVALMPDTDGIGVVSFDEAAHPRLGITKSDAAGRGQATTAIANHVTNVNGTTSIGNGVESGHDTIASASGYDSTALVVFTDGEENTYKFIHDVKASIDDRVFAVGLGTANQLNPVALNQLVSDTGGYLLLTDDLGPSDIFKLQKYFVQILASATNAEIVVDPDGSLPPAVEIKVPFLLTGADYTADAMLLSPAPWAFSFQLETPGGTRIDHASLGGTAGVTFQQTANLAFYRLSMPVMAGGASAQAGRWYIVLQVPDDRWKRYLESRKGNDTGVPFSAVVHARSSLNFGAWVHQASYVPGATLELRATLSEMDLPVDHRAQVKAEVTRPGGSAAVVSLAETEPGVFEAAFPATASGTYAVHFRAVGKTLSGAAFTREQLRTAMTWAGGDDPPPRGQFSGPARCPICDFFRRLLWCFRSPPAR